MHRVSFAVGALVLMVAVGVDRSRGDDGVVPVSVAPTSNPVAASGETAASAPDDAEKASRLALLKQKLAERDRLQAEIAQLSKETETPQAIRVNMEMLEVSLTKLRKLGLDFSTFENGNFAARLTSGDGGVDMVTADVGFDAFLAMLKRTNVAKTLSRPCVMTTSGQRASFFAGVEVPVPAPDGKAAVTFHEAGTRVDLLAESLGNGRVRLAVKPRISEISDVHALEANGLSVPAFNVRQCAATCEMAFGETAVLSGPTQERVEASRRDDGQVTEATKEIAFWVVVRAEDAAARRESEAASAQLDVTRR